MKKVLLLIAVLLITTTSFAQQKKEVKLNEETNLIEATYYHDNGEVSQKGTFNLAGKLHGEWVSFNAEGDKISQGNYLKGIKTGKWLFWQDDIMKEVEFSDNVIASVINKESKSKVATKN